MAQNLIATSRMGSHIRPSAKNDDTPPREGDGESDEAPETPPDEPGPPRLQDPLPEPTRKGPYTVTGAQPIYKTGALSIPKGEWRVES
jgi:hypothetical protein